jgi:hypothetical protein
LSLQTIRDTPSSIDIPNGSHDGLLQNLFIDEAENGKSETMAAAVVRAFEDKLIDKATERVQSKSTLKTVNQRQSTPNHSRKVTKIAYYSM